MIRSGPIDEDDVKRIAGALGLSVSEILHHQWVDNGHGMVAVMFESAEKVLSIKLDWLALSPFNLGVFGLQHAGSETTVEVRAFIGREGYEDPATGSLNASLAQCLIAASLLHSPYIAAQGTALQHSGCIDLH
ncbi:PhzF family phenazine biosynthesis protein [Stutzerimonas sp. NM35]